MLETVEIMKLATRIQRLKALKAQLADTRQPGTLACKHPFKPSQGDRREGGATRAEDNTHLQASACIASHMTLPMLVVQMKSSLMRPPATISSPSTRWSPARDPPFAGGLGFEVF